MSTKTCMDRLQGAVQELLAEGKGEYQVLSAASAPRAMHHDEVQVMAVTFPVTFVGKGCCDHVSPPSTVPISVFPPKKHTVVDVHDKTFACNANTSCAGSVSTCQLAPPFAVVIM